MALIRKKEKIFSERVSDKNQYTEDEWIQLMVSHPILIERPIVIYNEQAIIGRPPENILAII